MVNNLKWFRRASIKSIRDSPVSAPSSQSSSTVSTHASQCQLFIRLSLTIVSGCCLNQKLISTKRKLRNKRKSSRAQAIRKTSTVSMRLRSVHRSLMRKIRHLSKTESASNRNTISATLTNSVCAMQRFRDNCSRSGFHRIPRSTFSSMRKAS